MIIIPSRFIGDIGIIASLILCLLPLEFEVSLSNFSRLNEFHVVDVDSFSNEVGLFKTSLIIVINEAVD